MIPNEEISLVIADDHPIMLSGLYEQLVKHNYNILGQAVNGTQALELIFSMKPKVAILDVDMPWLTGFEVIKAVKQKNGNTQFIILSLHSEAEYVAEAKSHGVLGYLLKEDSFAEIEKCIHAVMRGEEYFSTSFEAFSLDNASEELQKLKLVPFSELAILKLLSPHFSSSKIAETLCVSARTIEKHRSNIIVKLDIAGAPNALIHWALLHKNIILNQ
jgi:DNA-binding NarL/FixJ family response regulator